VAAAVEVALAEQWARAVAAWPSVTLFDEVVALGRQVQRSNQPAWPT
jgi:hypothetical protein